MVDRLTFQKHLRFLFNLLPFSTLLSVTIAVNPIVIFHHIHSTYQKECFVFYIFLGMLSFCKFLNSHIFVYILCVYAIMTTFSPQTREINN